jgi:hypothetical protein
MRRGAGAPSLMWAVRWHLMICGGSPRRLNITYEVLAPFKSHLLNALTGCLRCSKSGCYTNTFNSTSARMATTGRGEVCFRPYRSNDLQKLNGPTSKAWPETLLRPRHSAWGSHRIACRIGIIGLDIRNSGSGPARLQWRRCGGSGDMLLGCRSEWWQLPSQQPISCADS